MAGFYVNKEALEAREHAHKSTLASLHADLNRALDNLEASQFIYDNSGLEFGQAVDEYNRLRGDLQEACFRAWMQVPADSTWLEPYRAYNQAYEYRLNFIRAQRELNQAYKLEPTTLGGWLHKWQLINQLRRDKRHSERQLRATAASLP